MSVLWRIHLDSDADWQGASQRARTRALKAAMLAMAEMWKRDYLPLHFMLHQTRYGYQKRKPEYLRRKARAGSTVKNARGRSRASFSKVAMGGVVDLVYQGLLKRRILKSEVKGYPTRASVILRGPDYFTTRPRNPARPNLAREILIIIDSERQALRAEATKVFYNILREPRRRGRPRKS